MLYLGVVSGCCIYGCCFWMLFLDAVSGCCIWVLYLDVVYMDVAAVCCPGGLVYPANWQTRVCRAEFVERNPNTWLQARVCWMTAPKVQEVVEAKLAVQQVCRHCRPWPPMVLVAAVRGTACISSAGANRSWIFLPTAWRQARWNISVKHL